jgi:hypothetical protein
MIGTGLVLDPADGLDAYLRGQMKLFIGDIAINARTRNQYRKHEAAAKAGIAPAAEHAAIFQMWKGSVGAMSAAAALVAAEQFARQAACAGTPGSQMTLASILAIVASRERYLGDDDAVAVREGETLYLIEQAAIAGHVQAERTLPVLAGTFSSAACRHAMALQSMAI